MPSRYFRHFQLTGGLLVTEYVRIEVRIRDDALYGVIAGGEYTKLIGNRISGWQTAIGEYGDDTKLPKPFDPPAQFLATSLPFDADLSEVFDRMTHPVVLRVSENVDICW